MKKIINRSILVLCAAIIGMGCGDKPNKAAADKSAETANVLPKVIVGVGKVLPEAGITQLSVSQTGKVVSILRKMGDTLSKGDVLFTLEAIDEQLDVSAQQAAVAATQANAKANSFDIATAKAKLNDAEQTFRVSKALLAQRAETQERVTQDSVAFVQQKIALEQALSLQKAQQAQVKEQETALDAAQSKFARRSYKALSDGVLTQFDVTLGSILSPGNNFGELASLSDLVIEGELDELYASDILLGQAVDIALVGRPEVIASGVVSFVGSGLQNKSIIYETVGEANDRRVRRFTVKLNTTKQALLMNQKVECKIKL